MAGATRPAGRERGPHGPYATQAAAMEDAADVYLVSRLINRRGVMAHANEGLLLGALRQASTELGAYDRQIVGWLAEWEPQVVQVVIGWIERAHAAERCAGDGPTEAAARPSRALVHAFPPLEDRGADRSDPQPRCGAASGRMAVFAEDVTCPACLAALRGQNGGVR